MAIVGFRLLRPSARPLAICLCFRATIDSRVPETDQCPIVSLRTRLPHRQILSVIFDRILLRVLRHGNLGKMTHQRAKYLLESLL